MMAPGFGTTSVAIATTPTVVSTFINHILGQCAPRRSKSSHGQSIEDKSIGTDRKHQLSYEEGIQVVRRFLEFASKHGVEEVQSFTSMRVPVPHWVRRKVATIPQNLIEKAEDILATHLATYGTAVGNGLKLVGGGKWWRVRGRELEGEWIEMQKDYVRRTTLSKLRAQNEAQHGHRTVGNMKEGRKGTVESVRDASGANVLGERVILYIHGGAFFFSSLDTHRYQIQRHARKAGARAFAPGYRLAPQYPFPCGLLDSLASYLYLIEPPPGAHEPILPTSIILMGDSAGGGMVISLLILIREMGLPMPAGASLVSPWVDLTHSMPSISGWDGGDYIPSSGFHYKPSAVWPPLPGDGVNVRLPDGTEQSFDEQIQMYCPNNILTHPLVSPVNAGSLGGLCPLFIIAGGSELLRDEIIYLGHKAANPTTYPPSSLNLADYPDQKVQVDKYLPTKVHLQVYDGCCHVAPTLSWTRSARYMYRGIANFNIWALTAATKAIEQKHNYHRHHKTSRTATITSNGPILKTLTTVLVTEPESMPQSTASTAAPSAAQSVVDLTKPIITSRSATAANHDDIDVADVESEASSDTDETASTFDNTELVSVRGIEPSFSSGILAERVSSHGRIYAFEPISEVPALVPGLREHIGRVHVDGAIQKWLAKRRTWDDKYASALAKWRGVREGDRSMAMKGGFLTRDLQNEQPPLCSLAGMWDSNLARAVGRSVDEPTAKTSGAVMLWMKMSSKADKEHAGGENSVEIAKIATREAVREDETSNRRSSA